jgi:hypothetical protein
MVGYSPWTSNKIKALPDIELGQFVQNKPGADKLRGSGQRNLDET